MTAASSPARPTPAQTNVLRLVAEGLSNKEIGHRLGRREQTVKKHVAALMAACGRPRSRVRLALWYVALLAPDAREAFVHTIGVSARAPARSPRPPCSAQRIASPDAMRAAG